MKVFKGGKEERKKGENVIKAVKSEYSKVQRCDATITLGLSITDRASFVL
ncbi:hypothetical protein Glove_130g133 [Diversispora epigaea]|uniref:Uncharacterized protein n=1 Tax=Diversispora epigaea TaxID=1348612 RepID=A0A397J246_9GLOM|nr:hypothetical protein Glove_130g133 [Diversispora epigaea]